MPKNTNATTNANNTRNRTRAASIRDELEKQAWILNPRLTNKLTARLTNRLQKKKAHMNGCDNSAHRIMRWQDRTLLAIGAILLTLFVIRAETAVADEPQWGLQLNSDSGTYTELAVDTDIQLDITGLVARVEITQRFTNRSSQWAEGLYRFPLPEGAAAERSLRLQ